MSMTKLLLRYGIVAAAILVAVVAVGSLSSKERVLSETTVQAAESRSDSRPRVEASALVLRGKTWPGKAASILKPGHPSWQSAAAVPVMLNLSPRIYATDKISSSAPPDASVRCIQASDGTVILLTWKDATKDQPAVRKPSPAGAGARVRVVHSQMTDRFPDAAAVMVPVDRNPAANPCLQMGEKDGPVDLYFWHGVKGAAVMNASGRATTERTGKGFPCQAVYADSRWQVTFALPKLPNGTPVAFATWDGNANQRGGLKYYSLWHSLR